MLTRQVDRILTITDATALADKLVAGGFCTLRWELIPDHTDLDEQKQALTALCEEKRTLIDFIDLARKNLTVVFKHWAPPPDAALHDLISGVEKTRWKDAHP